MAASLLPEILEWSISRPAWQRDALRRIFLSGKLGSDDFAELTEIAKAVHGLSSATVVQPLANEHIAISDVVDDAVSLLSVTHRAGVNALASQQTVSFANAMTIVFGNNAAGKSGYTRILKQACRSRYVEDVKVNVLSENAPTTPRATIMYRQGDITGAFEWFPKAAPSNALAAVSIFDSHCVPVYLKDKNDVAFRPLGLDVFDKLSSACAALRSTLEKERAALIGTSPVLPSLASGTKAQRLVDGISSLTSPDAVRALSTLTKEEVLRLGELRKLERDFRVADPKKLARELMLRASRIDKLVMHVASASATFEADKINRLAEIRKVVEETKARAADVRAALSPTLLPGTGGDDWVRMWVAAREFSAVAYADTTFPKIDDGARCVLCQQSLSEDAIHRFSAFAEYVTSDAQAAVDGATERYNNLLAEFTSCALESADVVAAIADLSVEEPDLGESATLFNAGAIQLQRDILAWNDGPVSDLRVGSLPFCDGAQLRRVASGLRSRAQQLEASPTGMSSGITEELKELDSRTTLAENLAAVLDAIERKKRVAAYGECLDDVATNAITKKSTELTRAAVTDTLRDTFSRELDSIGFDHLEVEIQAAGGAKGTLFHKLVFTHAPTVNVLDVLSEGEARALAFAAFMTELSTAPTKSAIVFDDPVSSLDHIWRERIAKRLADEASLRQVIIFTHDLLFLHYLKAEAEKHGVEVQHQYIRRDGEAGVCISELPWVATTTKSRIGLLKNRIQTAEKTHRDDFNQYESQGREIYGLLRESWEQAVAEILLNGVVERYRPSIETNRARRLYDIRKEECLTMEQEMAECSRWIRGHDSPPADGTPFPAPAEIRARIENLEKWVDVIRKRRQAKEN